MAYQNSPRIVTDGLVLCLDAGNTKSYPGTGTNWTDMSGYSNNGALTNGPTFNSANGGSIVFDGTNDLVAVSPSSSVSFSDKLTISIWIKFNAINSSGFNQLVIKWDDAVGLEYHFATRNAKFSLYLNTTIGGVQEVVWGDTTFQTGTWYNIVATWNGSVANAYINGVFEKSGNKSGTITATNAYVGIARKYAGAFDPTNCYISQVCFYNRALTPSEILQNYNSTKSRFGL